jgi:hypothetical protein
MKRLGLLSIAGQAQPCRCEQQCQSQSHKRQLSDFSAKSVTPFEYLKDWRIALAQTMVRQSESKLLLRLSALQFNCS